MESFGPVNYHRAQDPDHKHWPDIVTPLYLSTYLETMDIIAVSAYGQKKVDRINILTLIPEI